MIDIKEFGSRLLKINKRSYKNIHIYYIGYIVMKHPDNEKINSLDTLYLVTDKIDGCIEKENGNKYLTLVSAEEK